MGRLGGGCDPIKQSTLVPGWAASYVPDARASPAQGPRARAEGWRAPSYSPFEGFASSPFLQVHSGAGSTQAPSPTLFLRAV